MTKTYGESPMACLHIDPIEMDAITSFLNRLRNRDVYSRVAFDMTRVNRERLRLADHQDLCIPMSDV